ncbi:IclR family acetate operon transcriptional repressor [Mycetocola sp. CAN_C7]|uniref:IclR family transcriptional regulator n=1 Tax=Mycetocola sp. CAN_C7 TaxID=2787724 RepID=UPI0018CA1A6E
MSTVDTDVDQPKENSKSGVLGRAITLLELVATHADGIGVREAARVTGIDRSAVSRILTQFEELGYVEQALDRGMYAAGPSLFSIVAALAERDTLVKAAEPFLKELVSKFNETCYVASRVDDSLVFRGKVDCEHTIRYVIDLGKPFPLVSGAAGMAILAGMPAEESDRILSGGLPANTPQSITDQDEFRRQLEIDRNQGYTYSPGRWVRNGAGISAPFFDAGGRCAGAITLSCPADRLEALSIEEVGASIRTAAQGLSRRLGFIPADAATGA